MNKDIRDYPIHVAQSEIDDLHRRLRDTRWVDKETSSDWSQGIPLAYIQDIHKSWLEDYDWRQCEQRINDFGSFMTTIDDVDIHFLHVKSKHENAKPLLLAHGWPGSIVEFFKVIPMLTDPMTYGGTAEDAFHLVIPTMPGYGFSGKPSQPGWKVEKIARAWAELMARLGYSDYFAQGGDWGSAVTIGIGKADPDHCRGVHVNMVIAFPDEAMLADPTAEELKSLAQFAEHSEWGTGYSKQQSTRPQTLGYALVDSPIGQAAWVLEKFHAWADCDGHPENIFTRQELLDNVMMYWLTASGGSSARLYWESFNSIDPGEFKLPMGASLFPVEIVRPSRRWADKQYTNIVFWAEHERGGHFAAFEKPEIYVDDVRKCFALMR
jgi:epoxide hydrolase